MRGTSRLALAVSWVAALAVAISLGLVPQARAQREEGTATEIPPEAVSLFRSGLDASEQHRWEEALRYFEQARELIETPNLLFNIARAQQILGHHLDARETLRGLFRDYPPARLRDEFPSFPASAIEQAHALLLESGAHIATLALLDLEEGAEHQIELDGRPVTDDGARPLEIDADAGDHGLTLSRPGFLLYHWSGNLRGGARYPLRIALTPEEHASPIWQEPWIWILTGAVVALAASLGGYFGWEASLPEPPECDAMRTCVEIP